VARRILGGAATGSPFTSRHYLEIAHLMTRIKTALALLLLGPALLAAAPAHAQSPQAPLIAPGRLALPITAFGAGAQITHLHIDRTASAIDYDSTLSTTSYPSHQGHRYTLFHGSGTLYEDAVLPATRLTGSATRRVGFMATAFPTTGAAQVVYARDTAVLSTTWTNCGRPDLVAVAGRYSTRSCQYHKSGNQASYILVTGIQGNVALAFYVSVPNDHAGSLLQVQNDASTVARKAFAAYAQLPVRRGPAPTGTSTPVVVASSDTHPYQATIVGASVSFERSRTEYDGSITYGYDIKWAGAAQVGDSPDFYLINANNADQAGAQEMSDEWEQHAQKGLLGGKPQTDTTTNGWVVREEAPDGGTCSVSTGRMVGTVALLTVVWASDCTTATSRTKAALTGVVAAVTASST
jgi:hypothetical protein